MIKVSLALEVHTFSIVVRSVGRGLHASDSIPAYDKLFLRMQKKLPGRGIELLTHWPQPIGPTTMLHVLTSKIAKIINEYMNNLKFMRIIMRIKSLIMYT